MEINAVDPQCTHVGQLANLQGTEQEADQCPGPTTPADESSQPAPPVDEPAVDQTGEETEIKGVLQHLLEGHYKAVPDVRLRINFFEELAAIEAQQLQAVAEENVDGILEAVGAVVGTLAEESEPAGEPAVESSSESAPEVPADVLALQEEFAQDVNDLKDDFLAAEVPSTTALVEGMQSAFDEFVAALMAALTPEGADVPAEEPPPDEGGEEPASVEPPAEPGAEVPADVEALAEQGGEEPADVEAAAEEGGEVTEPPAAPEPDPGMEAFIAELRAAFDAAMDELTSAFGQVGILPGLSEPTGNGVAYEKFLAIYNEMRGIGTTDEGEPAPEPLEAEG